MYIDYHLATDELASLVLMIVSGDFDDYLIGRLEDEGLPPDQLRVILDKMYAKLPEKSSDVLVKPSEYTP